MLHSVAENCVGVHEKVRIRRKGARHLQVQNTIALFYIGVELITHATNLLNMLKKNIYNNITKTRLFKYIEFHLQKLNIFR